MHVMFSFVHACVFGNLRLHRWNRNLQLHWDTRHGPNWLIHACMNVWSCGCWGFGQNSAIGCMHVVVQCVKRHALNVGVWVTCTHGSWLCRSWVSSCQRYGGMALWATDAMLEGWHSYMISSSCMFYFANGMHAYVFIHACVLCIRVCRDWLLDLWKYS